MNADILTVDAFLALLAPYANRDMLAPSEASSLQLKIAELVLDHTIDISLLKFLSRFLTQSSYDELVEERNIEHQCGYPLCNKSPQHKVRRLSHGSNGSCVETSTRYQIWNRKPSMILPNTYLSQYCCKDHYQASMFYRNQLSQEAVFSRKDITVIPPFATVDRPWYENNITCLEEVLAKHRELKEQGKSLTDVIAMMSGLSVADGNDKETSDLAKLIEDFDIVEHEGGMNSKDIPQEPDREAAARGIDGYITNGHSLGGYMV
ncbi:hypothetical protein FT663_00945 [Candidozyma haemuli var. vulneris]|nr:hypothetical protein FT662_00749 [[Candida] haemuloni var. vulneris]KAF3994971.1 hypothetical protein FT663_00945 [[Candida] haemuloni var. vulneris]